MCSLLMLSSFPLVHTAKYVFALWAILIVQLGGFWLSSTPFKVHKYIASIVIGDETLGVQTVIQFHPCVGSVVKLRGRCVLGFKVLRQECT